MQGYLSETHGDPDAVFASAYRVFEHTFSTPRYFGAAIEPRATMVWIDERGIVHVYSTNKSPFALRKQLSIATGLPVESIVVEQAYIGGDFGARVSRSMSSPAIFWRARRTGRSKPCAATSTTCGRPTFATHREFRSRPRSRATERSLR
jgi:CO/xanthine dehydrogenase Mo-binding subunit